MFTRLKNSTRKFFRRVYYHPLNKGKKLFQSSPLLRLISAAGTISIGAHLTKVSPSENKENIDQYSQSMMYQEKSNERKLTFDVREPKSDLDMIGGYTDVLEGLIYIVKYLQDPKSFTQDNIKQPKGVLLSGPTGVGKTFIAEAIAGHAGVPFILVSASNLLDIYVGGSEKNLRDLFDIAKKNAPCVLCIDEIDSISNRRFSDPRHSSDHHANTLVNQLLTLLADDNPGVVVIGTTNNFNSIDSAVVRAGRFDRHITIAMPDSNDRARILAIHAKGKNIDSSVNLDDLSKISAGFSAAKLSAWVNEAAIYAASEKSNVITIKHFDQARSILAFGSLGRSNHAEQKRFTATHEIGHALVGHLLGKNLYKVSTRINGNSSGHTEFVPNENKNQSKEDVLNEICVLLAGRAIEQVYGISQMGSANDITLAKKDAEHLVQSGLGSTVSGENSQSEIESILQEQLVRAREIIEKNKITCDRLIEKLITEEEIYKNNFIKIISGENTDSSNLFSFWTKEKKSVNKEFVLPSKRNYTQPILEQKKK